MEHQCTPMGPDEAKRRFVEMLDEAELPHLVATLYDAEINELQLIWESGLRFHLDLSCDQLEPLDEWDRASIQAGRIVCECETGEPIHVYVPGSADGPRDPPSIPGVHIHHGPPLHSDDLATANGIPVTSPSRTLIDLAEILSVDELRAAFARARDTSACSIRPRCVRASNGVRRSSCSTESWTNSADGSREGANFARADLEGS